MSAIPVVVIFEIVSFSSKYTRHNSRLSFAKKLDYMESKVPKTEQLKIGSHYGDIVAGEN